MIRAKIWFRCAAVHDPICPVVARPAAVGWEAKHRQIDLTIERAFRGDELMRRMKGWITVDPSQVIDIVNKYGKLKILDDRDLVIELAEESALEELQKAAREAFGSEVDVEPIEKSSTKG
jgi:hypothetical protein